MQVDRTILAAKYNITELSVISSTQISSRTRNVLEKLQATPVDGKPNLVILTTKARTASKLISIVEIAKRDLVAKGLKCFQYNALSSEMIELPRDHRQDSHGTKQKAGNESESEDAFETMGAEPKSGTKQRLVPVVTTYLSLISVRELKTAYG